jgi:hypothetical protein
MRVGITRRFSVSRGDGYARNASVANSCGVTSGCIAMTSPVLLRPVKPASMDDPATVVLKGTARSTKAQLVPETIPKTVDTIAPGFSASRLDLDPRGDEVGLSRPTLPPSCPTRPDAGSSAESVIYDITVPSIAIGDQGVGLESSNASCRHSPRMHSATHPDVKTTSSFLDYTRSRSSLLELPTHASLALARAGECDRHQLPKTNRAARSTRLAIGWPPTNRWARPPPVTEHRMLTFFLTKDNGLVSKP